MTKLDIQHKHIIRLIGKDRDAEGWAKVSKALTPTLHNIMPPELVEFEMLEDGSRARLTPDGEKILLAMEWL